MISTHILDTTKGSPAANVSGKLYILEDDTFKLIKSELTNEDGRINFDVPFIKGQYKIHFDIESYFKSNNSEYFFPMAELVFNITDTNRKYHVPILLNPYGYSTYRGS